MKKRGLSGVVAGARGCIFQGGKHWYMCMLLEVIQYSRGINDGGRRRKNWLMIVLSGKRNLVSLQVGA